MSETPTHYVSQNEEAGAVGAATTVAPPTQVSSAEATALTVCNIPPPKPDMYAPPPYEECEGTGGFQNTAETGAEILPPTYEEVQRIKAQEANEDFPLPPHCHAGPPASAGSTTDRNGVRVLRISSLGGLDPETAEIAEEQLLGTDFMFFVAFAAAFVFNWVGFVLLLCFCHTVAGRTGALAGFGLSLAKWAVIVRHSTDLVADSNTWLLWLIMALGMLICARAILQYIQAKREWHQVPHNSRHRFFLFY
ncbi:unnamed protein product [Meganyctiphanes norvegica]|uniref:Uncharacterized protein n=1 Tax=Meganyctiphanes norvegica TaxID=48144 RepID=A0AAV2PJ64_MEGNR